LSIAEGDLSIDPNKPKSGSVAQFSVTVNNDGGKPVLDPKVKLYLYDPVGATETLIENVTLNGVLVGGDSKTATVDWNVPTKGDTFTIFAALDPNNEIIEEDESNNSISIIFETQKEIVEVNPNRSVYLPLITKP
jgi:subtilase family serine protease